MLMLLVITVYVTDYNNLSDSALFCLAVFVSSENMTFLRQRFDELLDIGDTLSAKNVSQTKCIACHIYTVNHKKT